MLTISPALNAGQAQTYHAQEYSAKGQNYWSQGQTAASQWHGQLAASLGLTGVVTSEEFARLSQGQHPITQDQMVQHRQAHEYANAEGAKVKSVEHRAGWDATFSAPKSVSLVALVVEMSGCAKHTRPPYPPLSRSWNAIRTLAWAAITLPRNTGNFAAATFEHDTARPVDGYAAPQLHTHAVIFNVTARENGETRAIQERGLFASQSFVTSVYQAELMYRIRGLGYEIEQGKSGAPEIKGFTREYLEASSPRSQQIQQYLTENQLEGSAAAQIAAHNTRDKKALKGPDQVLEAHRELAARFGEQPATVPRGARAHTGNRTWKRPSRISATRPGGRHLRAGPLF